MLDLIVASGTTLFFNILQLAAGCILSIPIFFLDSSMIKEKQPTIMRDLLFITMFTIFGAALPLNIYGVLPIAAALLHLGFKSYIVLPVIVSNLLFNMLIPFNDAGFIWRTGSNRVVFALIFGIAAGLIFKTFKFIGDDVFNLKNMPTIDRQSIHIRGIGSVLGKYINGIGLYLVIGVLLDSLFQKYVLTEVFNLIFTNSYTASIPQLFGTYNVGNPFFQLTMKIIYTMLDLVKISGLLAILKPKGFVTVLGYHLIWIVLLTVLASI
ncbi:MAG: hypothetical protein N2484_11795 [Clostridia bacterium]|nr:hypothetical protein [Clostridia bacterium]